MQAKRYSHFVKSRELQRQRSKVNIVFVNVPAVHFIDQIARRVGIWETPEQERIIFWLSVLSLIWGNYRRSKAICGQILESSLSILPIQRKKH